MYCKIQSGKNGIKMLLPVIISGGAGSRLWPMSRAKYPKPFIRLDGEYNFLQKTFKRALSLSDVKEIITITNRDFFSHTETSYKQICDDKINKSYILEPFGKNTSAAIAVASLEIAKKYNDDALLLVLPSDHVIENHNSFISAVSQAMKLAESGNLVTFGIEPTSPKTGYGYIEADNNKVIRFVEKPNKDKAKQYLAQGNFYWNSGMFCFSAGAMIGEMEQHCPDIISKVKHCLDNSSYKDNRLDLNNDLFAAIEDISIDYSVMEKSNKVSIVKCNIGWNDIGSWQDLGEIMAPSDEKNNHVKGDVVLENVDNCIIQSDNRLVAGIGLSNLAIIDSGDAVLVANKDNLQDTKKIFQQLKKTKP